MRRAFFGIAVVCLFATPALAIDFSAPILNPFGTPFQRCKEKEVPACLKPLTLGAALADILWNGAPDEHDPRTGQNLVKGTDAIHRAKLAMRIAEGGEVNDLPAEDIALMKSLAEKVYPPIALAQIMELLDPQVKH